ncbi:mandelate racemase/muconate lactonizing enzyme family protein [Ahrensia sp. R2A130]|uniref:mandelate racemase/muconate lactonizing enzyme family protein n=1 Tax=Ahrensia sp. R2A130 TaxID=744979 RepID=UPI0001E0A489|nr:mandelate racemase/muconate lactonizing enzyme family protein [Ahrensia sp. R2A130]EFL88616.1 D-galactonate dehydratase [Ahrensia sp. R2A130]
MKITNVTAHCLTQKLDGNNRFDSAFSTFTERAACLVEIETDTGLIGWGECLGPNKVNAAIVEAMTPALIGRDPLDIEPIWFDLYSAWRDQGQRGVTMTAQSGIDIALWDIAGKHFGVPVYRLLGGAHRTSVPAYATGGFRPRDKDRLERLVEETAAYMADGFTATKIKIGFGVDEDEAVIRAVRDAIGDDAELMIDANHGYDAIEAIELGRRIADCRIGWFEEPVVPEQLNAYRRVREGQPIPVAGGETWHGRLAHRQAIEADAIDILQPDVAGCGGITEMRKIIAHAETSGIRVVPHVWGTGVNVAASLHMLATIPPQPGRHSSRDPWLEFDQTPHAYRMAVLQDPITQTAGRVAVPDKPGLGVEIDRHVLEEFRA